MCIKKLFARRSFGLLVVNLAALLPIGRGAVAAIVVNERDTEQQIAFADTSTFSDAVLTHASVFQITGNAGDTLSLNYSVPDGATGFYVTTSSGFSTSVPVMAAGSPNYTEAFKVSALATTSGSFTVGEQLGVNAAPSGADTTLSTGVSGSEHYLQATFNPLSNSTNGATWIYEAVISGNYSAIGTGNGDHELLSLNPAWTVTQNFKFNGTDTVFAAQISDYNSATDRIELAYQIYGGSTVALPGAAWLLLSGIGGVRILTRRRRGSARDMRQRWRGGSLRADSQRGLEK